MGMLRRRRTRARKAPRVEQYMTRLVHTIGHDAVLSDAHKTMRKYGIRHLPVTDGDTIVGLVSMRDLHLLETLKDVDATSVPVEDAMSERPYIVAPGEPIDRVAAKMAAERIGSALVVDDGEIRGIFTTIDALRALFHVWKTVP